MSNHGYHISCKMMMEGIEVPFRSAVITANPNGVEMNIDMHPTEKIFDLKPKTSVQILYRDWLGPEDKKQWRLLGEGYFSAFGKFDTSQGGGNRGVTMMCRDFRMDIRKTPCSLIYSSDESDTNGTANKYMCMHGLSSVGTDGVTKQSLSNRIFGGTNSLKGFSEVIKYLTVKVGGPSDLTSNSADGQTILDAFFRGAWMDSLSVAPYNQSIASRTRLDKKIVVVSNRAGYSFLSEQYMGSLIQGVVYGGSMFSSVEQLVMRLAQIFQSFPYSCSTPNIISIAGPNTSIMSDSVRKKITSSHNFGDPSLINSCMILPPLNFTAPPNCNIIFPSMTTDVSWSRDLDADITRGHFLVHQIFADLTDERAEQSFSIAREIPYSTVDFYKGKIHPTAESGKTVGGRPFLSLEERYAGVNMMYGNIEMYTVMFDARLKIMKTMFNGGGKSYIEQLKYLSETAGKDAKNLVDQALKAKGDMSMARFNVLKNKILSAYNKSNPIDKATVDQLTLRQAMLKYLNSRFNGRTISIQMDFNPNIISGFPAIVLAPDSGDMGSKTMRHVYGMVQMVKHTVSAQGEATTAVILSSVRFIDESSKIDANGSPLYCPDTDTTKSKFDAGTYTYAKAYKSPKYTAKYGLTAPNNSETGAFAYVVSDNRGSDSTKWAADLLLHDGGRNSTSAGEENANSQYMDSDYMPYRIGAFYESALGLSRSKHFMLGRSGPDTIMYDTVHEAAIRNLVGYGGEQKSMMTDYESAMTFVNRDVVTESDYYIRIMGASFKAAVPGEKVPVFTNDINILSLMVGYDELRGITKWYGFADDKYLGKGTSATPQEIKDSITSDYRGEFSSINENRPLTAFIEERVEMVKLYKQEVLNRAFTAAR